MSSQRSPLGEVLTELVLETFRFNGTVLEAGNRITKPHGLTSARWQVMGAIELAGTPLTVPQIARRMGLARQGVQRIVRDLSGLDMVNLTSNRDHKRAPLVSLSKEGIRVLEEINKAQAIWINELSEGLSERGVKQALKVVKAVRERSEEIESQQT